MARRKVAIAVVLIIVAFILINIIFSYVGTSDDDDNAALKRCGYSLLRVGVALVEYTNVKNTTLTPPKLQVLVDEGIIEAQWLRCSELRHRFRYFGELDLLGPRPPMVVWCSSGHAVTHLGLHVNAYCALNDRLEWVRSSRALLEEDLRTVYTIHNILAWDDSEGSLENLVEIAVGGANVYVRQFALRILGRTRSRNFEKTFVDLLEDKEEKILYEAAEALAFLKNPAGGGVLVAQLRRFNYFDRLRAFQALKELTGDGFGFNPALTPEMQEPALKAFDDWWQKVAATPGK